MRSRRDSAHKNGSAWRVNVARWRLVGPIAVWVVACAQVVFEAFGGSETSPAASVDKPTTICVSHILVHYWGARGATVVRTTETAMGIAREALAKVLEPGADFDSVGREFPRTYPDVVFERTGPFGRGKMAKSFDDTAFALRPGQIADWITSTPFGFHVIRRNPTVRCRQILIAYDGASRAIVTRTREEALHLAEKVRAEALQPASDFAALARRYSDSPDRLWGGDVGVFDRGRMVGPFEKAAFALKVGEISPAIESRFGFHIIQRIE